MRQRAPNEPFSAHVALSLTNVAAGGVALLILGIEGDSLRIPPTSCTVNVKPFLLVLPSWPLAGFVPSSAWISASFTVPSGLAGTVTLQSFVTHPSVAPGFSNSNGVTVVFG